MEMNTLAQVAALVRTCPRCGLAKTRRNAVPGEGPDDARLMFVGEGPGYHEDQQGRPFVGPAGQFLEELLGSIGLTREQVFITNVVKCRPPNNRDPLPAEIEACAPYYLERQIELIDPQVIVTLGRHALGYFLPKESIAKAHGTPRRAAERWLFPLYHPAAALHNPALRQTILNDMAKLGAFLKQLATAGAHGARRGEEATDEPPQQLSLF
jgi:DNA polymerase